MATSCNSDANKLCFGGAEYTPITNFELFQQKND